MRTHFVVVSFLAAVSCAFAQKAALSLPPGVTRICTIYFDKDLRRPARVEDSAQPCLLSATRALLTTKRARLYLVGTADRAKDNEAGHGTARIEQDMSGEDLRYADVAAYRALNTKAYLVRWFNVDAKLVIPLTIYDDGQWVEFYLVANGISFQSVYGKRTAPILSRPCTVAPCASGVEEFLIAQERERITR